MRMGLSRPRKMDCAAPGLKTEDEHRNQSKQGAHNDNQRQSRNIKKKRSYGCKKQNGGKDFRCRPS